MFQFGILFTCGVEDSKWHLGFVFFASFGQEVGD